MKIGIDLRALAEGKTTGVEVYITCLLKSLLAFDNNNDYVLFGNSSKNPAIFAGLEKFKNARLVNSKIPNRLLNLSFLLFRRPNLDKLLGGLDVFFSPRYLFAAISPLCKGVLTVHDLSFIRFPEFLSLKQKIWHRIVSDKKACRKADAIIAVSKATQADIVTYFGLPREKIFVVYPGIDRETYTPVPDSRIDQSVREKYRLKPNYIFFLGTVEPRKNILGLLQAFELLKARTNTDAELVLAGRLGWLYQTPLNFISNSKYRNAIKLLHSVPEQDKPSLYRQAKLFVFPSFLEGFGFPPLEAMSCGTPVVASYNSSLVEVLNDSCLYVNPFDCEQIYQAILQISQDQKLRLSLTDKGLKRARRFSWEQTARQTLAVINSMRSNNHDQNRH